MHGEEETLHGDSGYIGAKKRPEAIRKNKKGKNIKYQICRKPSTIKKLSKSGQYAAKKKAALSQQEEEVRKKMEFKKMKDSELEQKNVLKQFAKIRKVKT